MRAYLANDADAFERAIERLWIVDQIEITMPESKLHLLHPGPFVRMRLERLGEERQFVREDCRLALARLAIRSLDADQIAEIEFVRQLPAQVAHLLLANENLYAARPVEDLGLFVLAFDFAFGELLDRLTRPIPKVEKMNLALNA